MIITIPIGLLAVLCISLVLFILVTLSCHRSGLFDGTDSLGIGALFTLLFYALGWLIPSLAAWAAWATWWR